MECGVGGEAVEVVIAIIEVVLLVFLVKLSVLLLKYTTRLVVVLEVVLM